MKPMYIAGLVALVLGFLWWRNRSANAAARYAINAESIRSGASAPGPAGASSGTSRIQATYAAKATNAAGLTADQVVEIQTHPEARYGRGHF